MFSISQNNIFTKPRKILYLFLVLSFCNNLVVKGQSCSDASILAKYGQYRENLNKHFIVTDRDPSG
jgi:hypothetical protein